MLKIQQLCPFDLIDIYSGQIKLKKKVHFWPESNTLQKKCFALFNCRIVSSGPKQLESQNEITIFSLAILTLNQIVSSQSLLTSTKKIKLFLLPFFFSKKKPNKFKSFIKI